MQNDLRFLPYNWSLVTIALCSLAILLTEKDRKKKTGVNCKICGFKNCSLLYPQRRKAQKDHELGSFACSSFDHGVYSDIFYCPNCKNGFLKKIGTDEFESFIQEGLKKYKDVEDTEYISNIEARYLTNKKLIAKYKHLFEGKSVLEVGSYYGAFANEVINVADEFVAVEPSSHACKYLRKKFNNIDIHNTPIHGLKDIESIKGKKFDTIVLLDVIEHLPDPIQSLKELNYFLKEGGKIFFSTINIESTFSIALGPYWPWYMDMHYYYFSDRGLVDCLHRSGFVLNSHAHFPYYVYFSYFLKKVMSITLGIKKLPQVLDDNLKFPIPIKLGDTVLIIGDKI